MCSSDLALEESLWLFGGAMRPLSAALTPESASGGCAAGPWRLRVALAPTELPEAHAEHAPPAPAAPAGRKTAGQRKRGDPRGRLAT